MSDTTAPALPAGATALPPDPNNPGSPAWVVLGSPDELDFGDVMDALGSMKGGQGIGKAGVELRTAILCRLIKNWSFPFPMPATPETLRRLPMAAGLALYREIHPVYDMINGNSTKPVLTKETLEDKGSPTGGSSE
jgi:hypothetical protein